MNENRPRKANQDINHPDNEKVLNQFFSQLKQYDSQRCEKCGKSYPVRTITAHGKAIATFFVCESCWKEDSTS